MLISFKLKISSICKIFSCGLNWYLSNVSQLPEKDHVLPIHVILSNVAITEKTPKGVLG